MPEADSAASLIDTFTEAGEGFSLQHYWAVIRKHYALLGTFFGGTLFATALTLFLMPPTYKAETTLLIERNTPQILDFRAVLADSVGLESYDFYKTQYEILKGRALAARVIQEQALATDPVFTGAWRDAWLSTRLVDAVKGGAAKAKEWLKQWLSSPEPVEDDPRLDPRPPPLGIDRDHPVEIFAAIDDQSARHGLPALRGAAAARQYRHPFLARNRDRRRGILAALRHDDPQRFDLVDRRIGAVAPPAERVEQHLAAGFAAQPLFEARPGGIVERHTLSRNGLVYQSDTGLQTCVNA